MSISVNGGSAPTPVEELTVPSTSRRRRRWPVVVAGLVLLVAVPAVVAVLHGRDDLLPGRVPGSIYSLPARGDLAADADVDRALSDLPASGALPSGRRHVVWAGLLPTGRFAYVAARTDGGTLVAAWLVGPRSGGSPDDFRIVSSTVVVDEKGPAALVYRDDSAVVVGLPGDRVRVSPRPYVAANGEVQRRYRSARVTDGVAVVAAADEVGFPSPATRIRVTRDGSTLVDASPPSVGLSTEAPRPTLTYLRGTPTAEQRTAVAKVVGEIASEYGLGAGELVEARVLMTRDIALLTGSTVPYAVVAARLPSGAWALRSTDQVFDPDDHTLSIFPPCLDRVLATTSTPEEALVATTCDLQAAVANARAAFTLLTGPATASSAVFLDSRGRELDPLPLTSGALLVARVSGAVTVRVVDAAGVQVAAGPVSTTDKPPSADEVGAFA